MLVLVIEYNKAWLPYYKLHFYVYEISPQLAREIKRVVVLQWCRKGL